MNLLFIILLIIFVMFLNKNKKLKYEGFENKVEEGVEEEFEEGVEEEE